MLDEPYNKRKRSQVLFALLFERSPVLWGEVENQDDFIFSTPPRQARDRSKNKTKKLLIISLTTIKIVVREMKLLNIKKKLRRYPYVTSAFFSTQAGSRYTINNQLVRWVKDGELIRLKKGLYTLNNEDRGVGLSQKLIANILYYPSYVSLEYALSYYDMIPEGVFQVTSVTPKKTKEFSNKFGRFSYNNIVKKLFFGYELVKDENGFDALIATPEKALLDFFYLRTPANMKIELSYFEESLRLQNMELIDLEKLKKMAKRFKMSKIDKIVGGLLKCKDELL